MPQNNQLNAYTRVDASGRIIPSTTVLRQKRPVTGRWMELKAYQCCDNQEVTSLVSTPASVALTTVNFTLFCSGVAVAKLSQVVTTTTLTGLVAAANTNFSAYGVFTEVGTTVVLALKKEIGTSLCPAGVLTFTLS